MPESEFKGDPSRNLINWDGGPEAYHQFERLLDSPENIEQIKGVFSRELHRAGDFFRSGGLKLLPEKIAEDVLTNIFYQSAVALEDLMVESATPKDWDRTVYRLKNLFLILRELQPFMKEWEDKLEA